MSNSQIYLIANNQKISFDLSKIKESVVCHFNVAKYRNLIEESNTNFLMMNCRGSDSYFMPDRIDNYSGLYFVCGSVHWETSQRVIDFRNKFGEHKLVLGHKFGDNYPVGKYRSVGYCAIRYFESTFDKLNLVGFNFSGIDVHDWNFEKRYAMENKKVVFIS